MRKTPTARERARAELTREIKEEARGQLAAHGELSLRAVARELGMASSAIYRYFPSRDDLLTALIIDSYNAVGEGVEEAIASKDKANFPGQWTAACHALRDWSMANPQEYALIYGSPIPGYRAPRDTVSSASRVPFALLGIVRDCHEAGRLEEPPHEGPPMTRAVSGQMKALATAAELGDVPLGNLALVVAAWSQVYGLVGLEQFGHMEGVFDDKRAIFDHSAARLAWLMGLRPRG